MKKFIMTMALLMAGVVGISAQETYVGAQYTRVNPVVSAPKFSFDRNTDTLGAVASITTYETKNLGLTAEGSANFNTGTPSQLYTAMGGLTLKSQRYETVKPFAKAVAGIAAMNVGNVRGSSSQRDLSEAFKVSAGVDYGKNRVKFRVFEVGYLQTRLFNARQDNLVVSTGIVF